MDRGLWSDSPFQPTPKWPRGLWIAPNIIASGNQCAYFIAVNVYCNFKTIFYAFRVPKIFTVSQVVFHTPVVILMNCRTLGCPIFVYTAGNGPPHSVDPHDTMPICWPPETNGPPLSPLHESRPSWPAQIILKNEQCDAMSSSFKTTYHSSEYLSVIRSVPQ